MTSRDFRLPDNPLEFIRKCVNQGKIRWTYHVNMRMKDRFILRQFIIESSSHYEIVEEYPTDKYFPSYLVYSCYQSLVFHILFAIDLKGDNVRIITAYYPSLDEWQDDLKKRR